MSKSRSSLVETFDAINSWFSGVRRWSLHPLANYEYFNISPSVLGISQACMLILLTVVHSGFPNLRVFWSTEFIRTKYFRSDVIGTLNMIISVEYVRRRQYLPSNVQVWKC